MVSYPLLVSRRAQRQRASLFPGQLSRRSARAPAETRSGAGLPPRPASALVARGHRLRPDHVGAVTPASNVEVSNTLPMGEPVFQAAFPAADPALGSRLKAEGAAVRGSGTNTIEHELVERARRVLPGGTFGNTAAEIVIREGSGGRVWDESGREYIDFLIGSGPMLIGHAHPAVTQAVRDQIGHGTTFFANNRLGIELAELIVEAVPCAEQVRYVSSGSEADAYAMRLVRAFRGRDKILKFEGGYHGMSDYGLMSTTPKTPSNSWSPVPDSAGIPAAVGATMLVAPFNDIEAVEALIRGHGDEIAGVIVEPMQRLIPPAPGFLPALRRVTARAGIPLIFDEVVTGFRLAWGGGQERYGVTPDLCTLGKVIGGGYPLAAIAGRADIMAHFDAAAVGADRFVKQIGTLSGNPVASAAGLATLGVLREPGTYDRLEATGRELMAQLGAALAEQGVPAQVVGEPSCFDAVFTTGEVRDYRGLARGDAAMQSRFNALLRERGILKGESKYYLSTAHDDRDVADAVAAFRDAARALMN
ncbi:MAG: aminotransferase class III-fold pyridoxal phosphate-dependent enzyme [Acetobacteraceae bacterium]|nr:aminotransferase class III-fold pyridoxal phosphate-dependent enzyme [Acetobacteraceae bacterium]